MKDRFSARPFRALLLILLVSSAALWAAEEKVAFNVESKKYHCLTCEWAIKCTKNCVEIPISEAKKRGGVACKVCHGKCR